VLTSGDLGEGEHGSVDKIQTMIFAMQVGLAALWRSFGVRPSAVIGHSVGEIAAAVTCGALSLPDGARLICRRSKLLPAAAGKGGMAMVGLGFAELAQRLADRDGRVVAAISASPASTVVSGEQDAVREFVAESRQAGLDVREVASDVAFHSPAMDPLARQLAIDAGDLVPGPRQLPMYLTAVTDPRADLALDSQYWAQNLRNPVYLTSAVAAAAADGHRAFIEIAPHPVVVHSITECLGEQTDDEIFVGWSLRRNQPEQQGLLAAVGTAHCHGVPVDWSKLEPTGELVDLPTVRWQRQQLWREPLPPTGGGGRGHQVGSHSLVGQPESIAGSAVRAWQTSLSDANRPYPGSHSINGTEVVPAAVLIETFLGALPEGAGTAFADVQMSSPLLTSPPRSVQVVQEGAELRLASRRADSNGPWEINANCRSRNATPVPTSWQPADTAGLAPMPTDYVSTRLTKVGVPTTGFEWTIDKLDGDADRLLAHVRVHELPGADPASWAPAVDAIMTVAPCVFGGEPELRMAAQIDLIELADGQPPTSFLVEARRDPSRPDVTDVLLVDESGQVLVTVRGLRYPIIGLELESADEDEATADTDEPWGTATSAQELRGLVEGVVRSQIAMELKLPEANLKADRPLVEQGMDSVMSAVIRRRLAKRFGQDLPATLLWQQPTLSALSEHISTILADELALAGDAAGQPVGSLAL
jgi:6-methylsalicylic acid synthase